MSEAQRLSHHLRVEAEAYQDELAALRAENERLREALKPFAFLAGEAKRLRHVPGSSCEWRLNTDDLFAARAALEPHQ